MATDSIFQTEEFAGYRAAWDTRQIELAHRKAYYDGTIYANVRERFAALGKLSPMIGPRLYRGTKALFLMLARSVDVDAGIVPGGWAFADDAPKAWVDATKTVLAWSDWEREGPLYVHFGAQYGVVGLKVVDDRAMQRVSIAVLDPTTFLLAGRGMYTNAPQLALIVETKCDEASGDDYEYAEVITAQQIRTFRNGVPYGYDGRDDTYPNDQGAVPIGQIRHVHTGESLGECTYQKAIPLLDEVNELASYLADIIRKHAEAQWMVAGAEPSDLVKSGDNVWFIPDPNGKVQAIVAGIDIPGVLAFIEAIRNEVQDGLPELAFAELKDKTQIATATLEIQLMELVLKIQRVRPNYDHGLCDALRMAGRAAKSMGLPDLGALDDEALSLDKARPVLPLDKLTQIQIAQAQLALDKAKAPPPPPPPQAPPGQVPPGSTPTQPGQAPPPPPAADPPNGAHA